MVDGDFDMPRIHKLEEWVEREMTESVRDYVQEWFQVEDVIHLTEKQVTEVENFVMTLSDYSPVQLGYFNIIDEWKEENESA
jgi:NADH dehydrogenase FAD-containing subunit